MPRPNVLILMTDQQRPDCLSCAGHPQIKTPNMDRLASEGVRFTQAATVSPVCMPARASFINSLYPHNHGMWHNAGYVIPGEPNLFKSLRRAGYLTAHVGKSHYFRHGSATGHLKQYEPYLHSLGLEHVHETTGPMATRIIDSYMTDLWRREGVLDAFRDDYNRRLRMRRTNPLLSDPSPLPANLYLDAYVGQRSVEFVEGYDDLRPMCLFVGFPSPHSPWDAPGEYANMYDLREAPDPIPMPEYGGLPEEIREMADFGCFRSTTLENIRGIRASYYGKISLVDHWVGRIVDALEDKGMLEDTLVAFWSDHGEILGDHRRIGKTTFHESSMRVPLIMRWPGHFEEGKTCDALVENIDVCPTILGVFGLDEPWPLGRSLLPLLEEPSGEIRENQLSEIQTTRRRFCLRTRDSKYAVLDDGKGFMLYDLAGDPDEQHNLIGQDEDLEALMRENLLRRLISSQHSTERPIGNLIE
jgi:choline-sulfatase